jgi:hypothetical protein
MEPFKLELFSREFPQDAFPRYEELDTDQIFATFAKVANAKGQDLDESTYIDFVKSLFSSGTSVRIDHEDLDLHQLASDSGLSTDEATVVFYNNQDLKAVAMKFSDLSKHLDDIWYPPSEDLIVISAEYDWLITLGHWNAARVHKLASS